jgi:acyl-CoA thioesterase
MSAMPFGTPPATSPADSGQPAAPLADDDMEHVRRFIAERDMFAKHLGIEIAEAARGYARAVMPLDAHHRNGVGMAHGGAIFAVADLAFAVACNTRGKVSVNLNTAISFLAPGRRGPLTAEAREISAASRVATYEIRVTDGEGTLIATCQATAYSKHQPVPGLAAEGVAESAASAANAPGSASLAAAGSASAPASPSGARSAD